MSKVKGRERFPAPFAFCAPVRRTSPLPWAFPLEQRGAPRDSVCRRKTGEEIHGRPILLALLSIFALTPVFAQADSDPEPLTLIHAGRVITEAGEPVRGPSTIFVRGGRIPAPNHGSSAWTKAKAIARIAHRDLWESPAHDALYFHATYVRPSWAGRMTTRATIDHHIFYR